MGQSLPAACQVRVATEVLVEVCLPTGHFFTANDCFASYGELSGQGNLEFIIAKVALGYRIASYVCPSFSPGCFGGLISVYSVQTRV